MKKIIKLAALLTATLSVLTFSSCIEETFPEGGTVTNDQIDDLNILSNGMEAIMKEYNIFNQSRPVHWDFGYPALMRIRDLYGADIAGIQLGYNNWTQWYGVRSLGADYLVTQFPWTFYYKLNFQANIIVSAVPDPVNALPMDRWNLGKAYFYKGMLYLDLARMYLQGNYENNPEGLTVPFVDPGLTPAELRSNPRKPASEAFLKIEEYLKYAETYLADYTPTSLGDISMGAVQGMLARLYLTIGNNDDAITYAKLAQTGKTPLTDEQYTDKTTGFNSHTSQNSWIWCIILNTNDIGGRSNNLVTWAAHVTNETQYGYGLPGVNPTFIDKYLFHQMGENDFRRKCFIYGDDPSEWNSDFSLKSSFDQYTAIKFRPGQGEEEEYQVGNVVSIPLMRMEEMMLIEAEAVGRKNLANGKTLLQNFVRLRDPDYVSTSTTLNQFIDEVYLQKRLELWGEGLVYFDTKRLNKGIMRSYTKTNHPAGYRFNTDNQPGWMDVVIISTEIDRNDAITVNNPNPQTPNDSPEVVIPEFL